MATSRSLKEVITLLEPGHDRPQPKSLRELSRRLRWQTGWQGSVGEQATQLPGGPISFREIIRRICGDGTVTLRFLSYNSYLLAAMEIAYPNPIAPIVRVNIKEKPARAERATELGQTLGVYDVCCLSEVFTSDSRDRIMAGLGGGWAQRTGPPAGPRPSLVPVPGMGSSGLFFLVKNRPITFTTHEIFLNLGDYKRDADFWSNKGMLLNVIDLGVGQLEIFQTHLLYGGGLLGSDPSDEDRLKIQRDELQQLADFYLALHQPHNVAIVTGDFNMSGADPLQYAAVRQAMDILNLHDLWSWDVYDHDLNEGYTCRFTDGGEEDWWRNFLPVCTPIWIGPEPAEDYCHDYFSYGKQPRGVGRYDYIFVERPTDAHGYNLEVSRTRRRPFERNRSTDKEPYLSDHLGLDVTIFISPR